MERYMYRAPGWNGEFRRVANGWEEYQNMVRAFTFSEEARAADSITLFDATRDLRVRLPTAGGQVLVLLAGATVWRPLEHECG